MDPATRPAESMAKNAAIGGLLAYALGVDGPEQLTAIVAFVGLVPGAVTSYVNAGGIRGVLRLAWRGRSKT